MVGIIDYGVGNLFSIKSSLAFLGQDAVVSSDTDILNKADRLILPGVGAFRDAAQKLESSGMDAFVKEQAASGKPLLGICLGMQLLFDKSYEYGEYDGLGLVPGAVRPLKGVAAPELKIPQMGWNALDFKKETPIFKYINEGDYVYFVHSYYACECDEYITATAEYSFPVTASVQNGNVFGTQFHPEKSGTIGLNILKAYCEI